MKAIDAALILLLWFIWAMLFVSLLSSCEVLIRRPPVKTDTIRAENEEKRAAARMINAHAAYLETVVSCLEAKFPKEVPSVAAAQRECGIVMVSPVQIMRSEKTGEVASSFSLVPGGGVGGILGGILP